MKLHKRILNQDWAQNVVTALAAAYLRFVRWSGNWEMRGWHHMQTLIDDGKPIILCYWHSRLVSNVFGWPKGYPLYQLSTAHRDGKLAGKTYQRLGITPVWLDSKSPLKATREMVKILKKGGIVSITPDGPKGPRQRMQTGALDMARLAGGAYIVPMSNSTSRAKVLSTWDRMLLPLPFGRGVYEFGPATYVAHKASTEEREAIRQEIEDHLNAISVRIDGEFGQVTPDPAPVPIPVPTPPPGPTPKVPS